MDFRKILIKASQNAAALSSTTAIASTTSTTSNGTGILAGFGGFTTQTIGQFTTVFPTIGPGPAVLTSGSYNPGSTSNTNWFNPPVRVTLEVFKAHVEMRKNKVLALYNKLDKTREIIPVPRVMDLIFKFACQSPFTIPSNASERILFEFNDEEFELVFEKPRDKYEKKLSLQLTPDMIHRYHQEKNADIEYQL